MKYFKVSMLIVFIFVILNFIFYVSKNKNKNNSSEFKNIKISETGRVNLNSFKNDDYSKLIMNNKNKQIIKTSGWLNQLYVSKDCSNIKLYPFPFLIEINSNNLNFYPQERLETENTVFTKVDKPIKINLNSSIKTCDARQDEFENSVLTITTEEEIISIYATKGIPFVKLESNSPLRVLNDSSILNIKYLTKSNFYIYNKDLVDNQKDIPEKYPQIKYSFIKNDNSYYQKITIVPKSPFVLLPHQQKNIINNTNKKYFKSVKGDVYSVVEDSVLVKLPIINIPYVFDYTISEKDEIKSLLNKDIEELGKEPFSDNLTSYWNGKKLFKIANLLILSEKISDKSSNTFLKDVLNKELSDFYTFSGESDKKYFIYYKNIGAIQNSRPDFGHEFLNDTHFHFGYYIYASAILCEYDTNFCTKYKNTIDLLIKSVASYTKSEYFPYLRHLSLYEGHSFASGLTKSGDGNNQESSSESLNFWYSAYLFNKIIKSNDEDIYYSSYLLEAESAKTYYLNYYSSKLYNANYKHKIYGIVWEGKNDFATWFSANPKAIYGIQFIPISFGSVYLQTNKYKDILTQLSKELSNTYNKEDLFQDLLLGYQILNEKVNPKYIEELKSVDSSNSKSWLYFINSVLAR